MASTAMWNINTDSHNYCDKKCLVSCLFLSFFVSFVVCCVLCIMRYLLHAAWQSGSPEHGQCWAQHQRVSVLHHHRSNAALGQQARRLWPSAKRVGSRQNAGVHGNTRGHTRKGEKRKIVHVVFFKNLVSPKNAINNDVDSETGEKLQTCRRKISLKSVPTPSSTAMCHRRVWRA